MPTWGPNDKPPSKHTLNMIIQVVELYYFYYTQDNVGNACSVALNVCVSIGCATESSCGCSRSYILVIPRPLESKSKMMASGSSSLSGKQIEH